MDFKNIHIGSLIKQRVSESGMPTSRLCAFMRCSEEEIYATYLAEEISTGVFLRWSKLLDYDFFRIYTQHIILYAPPSAHTEASKKKTALPRFRKNIYTREIIDFILELISSGAKTKIDVIEEYRIPKTTLYKWITKYAEAS